MTTIAYRDGILACDSLTTWGNTKVYETKSKIISTNKYYIGCSGNTENIETFVDWVINSEMKGLPPQNSNGEFIFVDKKTKKFFVYTGSSIVAKIKPKGNYFAVGSGSSYALGALEAGCSAIEAVRISCKYDLTTGGKVKSIKV